MSTRRQSRLDPAAHAEALLGDGVVVPVHAHDQRDDHFVSLAGATPRRVSVAEAARIASTVHGIGGPADLTDLAPGGPRHVSRRTVVRSGAAALGGLLLPSATPRYAFAAPGAADTLVVVFLRGGLDGLSAVVPVDDPAYYAARGPLAVPAEQTLALGPGHGLHPQMSALLPMWRAGELAFVTGVGAPWASRSHFVDQVAAERSAPAQVASGWLGRHLASASSATGTLRGLTIGSKSSLALATSFPTLATWTIDGFDVPAAPSRRDAALRTLDALYGDVGGLVHDQAAASLAAIGALAAVRGTPYVPSHGVVYPTTGFGAGLQEVARMVRSGVGVEVACLDIGGWDLHADFGLATDAGSGFSTLVRTLAEGLAALRRDLGARWARTTVVALSEFGRRVAYDGSGFDHGTGGLMLVAGGGVRGGAVYGAQPTLEPGNLHEGDLPTTLDYRQPLSEVVATRLRNPALATVFPGFTPGTPTGVV